MSSLGEFENIRNKIKTSKKSSITALHKFIFEDEGDRNSRKRIREFEGFNFTEDDEKYHQKVAYVQQNISQAGLISICLLLDLHYDEQNSILFIFKNLRKNVLMKHNDEEEDGDEEDGDEEDDDEEEDEDDEANEEDDDSVEDESVNEVQTKATGTRQKKNKNRTNFTMNFKDVEESIRPYDGSGNPPIEAWLNEFETMAEIMNWDELHKLVFAKKSLKGVAKMFVMSEKGLISWVSLKKALKNEFGCRTNSADLHKMLRERKRNKNENVLEYFYCIKGIAARGDIEESAVIQYVIDGIDGLNANKSMLYGTENLRDFKRKLNDYEVYSKRQEEMTSKQTVEKKYDKPKPQERKAIIKCYNCGGTGHISQYCEHKNKGTKCFKCNMFGHMASNCTNNYKKKEKESTRNTSYVGAKNDLMMKKVKIEQFTINALFDTGSKFNLLSRLIYENLEDKTIEPSTKKLIGFGNKKQITPIGTIELELEIDNVKYNIEALVISEKYMDVNMIIGENFCEDKEVTIDNKGVHFKIIDKKINQSTDEENEDVPDIFRINFITENDKKEIKTEHIPNKKIVKNLNEIVQSYKSQKPMQTTVEMKIILKDDQPVYQKARRLSQMEQNIINNQIDEWLSKEIIRNSCSDYASPVVLAKKKNGKYRLCIDYRKLNQKIIRDRYPLPILEDQLDKLQGALIFSTLDLKEGFFHIPIAENSIKYTSFIVPSGQYEFLRVPFGLCNSPSVFQRYINVIFKKVIHEGIAVIYMDDIMILAQTYEEGFSRLKEVLLIASKAGLNINWEKCNFLCTKVEYLGHIIENGTVRPSDHKTKAVMQYPKPTTVRQVQSFLGLSGYFRKFVKGYATIARPLSSLLKKDQKFEFGDDEEQAFKKIKSILSEQPILKLYRNDAETELHTDASKYGFGAILLQKDDESGLMHPIYYASGKTNSAEEKYSSYELEVLAVVKAIRRFRVYLLGIKFKLFTDCKAFTQTLSKKDMCPRVARWALMLEEYDYEVQHRSASSMKHVDALSRNPLPTCLMITESENVLLTRIKKAQENDTDLKEKMLKSQNEEVNGFVMQRGVLMKEVGDELRVAVPKTMQYQIIRSLHERGHFGINKTEILVSNEYWMPNMRNKIEKVIKNCLVCILAEKRYGKSQGLLHPIEKGSVPLDTYHVDHLGPLASTKKAYVHIFVIIDAFSKYVWLYATKSTTSAEVIKILKKQSVAFGNPRRIISDRGTAFTSGEFKEYCQEENVIHNLTTTGIPRANGQVERVNRILISMITKISAPNDGEWFRYLEDIQKVINSTPQSSTGYTPFKLMFGVEANLKHCESINKLLKDEIITLYNTERDEIRDCARQSIAMTQERNKKNFNKHRQKPFTYKDGDIVAIRRTQKKPGSKFSNKYIGPYEITKMLRGDRFMVTKIGGGDGPKHTSTAVDSMKLWTTGDIDDFGDDEDDLCITSSRDD